MAKTTLGVWGVLFTIFAPVSSVALAQAESNQGSVAFWASQRELAKHHSVKYQRIEGGDPYEAGEFHCHGEHCLVTADRLARTTVFLENPKYRATIQKEEGDEYRIRWLGNHAAVMKSASICFSDMFFMHVCDPGAVATVLSNHEYLQGIEPLESGEGFAYTIVSQVPANSGIHPAYAGAKVRIHGAEGAFPTCCEVILADSNGGGTRLEYQAFVEVDGRKLPSKIVATSIHKFGEKGEAPSEYHYDYSIMNDVFDTDRCYFTYYGLPEPDELGVGRWWLWVIGIVVLLVTVGFLRNRLYARGLSSS